MQYFCKGLCVYKHVCICYQVYLVKVQTYDDVRPLRLLTDHL